MTSAPVLDPFNLVKHGGNSHDQQSHGNRSGSPRIRETGGATLDEAWANITYDTPWNDRPEVGLGTTVTRRIGVLEGGTPEIIDYRMTSIAEIRAEGGDWTDRPRPTGSDGMPTTRFGEPAVMVEVPGSRRPLPAAFRVVAEAEYQQAVERGYFQTDGRMNIDAAEGTVFSVDSTGGFYTPEYGVPFRILRFDATRIPGLRNDPADSYVKTGAKVPVDTLVATSPVFTSRYGDRGGRNYDLVKHAGPGAHPNGSPQSAHAGGGTATLERTGPRMDGGPFTKAEAIARVREVFPNVSEFSILMGSDPSSPFHRPAETVDAMFSEETLRTIAAPFQYGALPGGHTTFVQDVVIRADGSIAISGQIAQGDPDLEGQHTNVGHFERAFHPDGTVHHHYLRLNGDVQGKGIGSELNRQAEAAYVKAGFSRIRLEAGLAVGGYAWARAGYRFDDENALGDDHSIAGRELQRGHPRRRVTNFAYAIEYGGTLNDTTYSLVGGTVRRIDPDGSEHVVAKESDLDDLMLSAYDGEATAQEIASFGQEYAWTSPETGRTTWLGKEFMAGSIWAGVKDLSAPTVAKAAFMWDDDEFPVRLDSETEGAYLARLAATAPDDVFDLPVGDDRIVIKHGGTSHDQSSHGNRGAGEAEPEGTGDCYPSALDYASAHPGSKVCHGTVTGTGPVAGKRFGHAWTEQTQMIDLPGREPIEFVTVTDLSNGNDVRDFPRDLYYKVGQIDPAEVARYDVADAMAHAVRTGHYGPWDEVAKHYGPGPHKNGSPQTVHGGGGSSGARHPDFGSMDCYSIEEAEDRLQGLFPNADITAGASIDNDGFVGEPWGGAVAGLEKMAEQFPEAAAEVVKINFSGTATDANGEVRALKEYPRDDSGAVDYTADPVFGLGIYINTRKNGRGGDWATINAALMEGVASRPFTAGAHQDLASFTHDIAVHEFGHVVHNTAMKKESGEDFFVSPDDPGQRRWQFGASLPKAEWPRNDKLWTEQFGPDKRVTDRMSTSRNREEVPIYLGSTYGLSAYPSSVSPRIRDWAAGLDFPRVPVNENAGDWSAMPAATISDYATTNRAELVAESFAVRHGIGDPRYPRTVPPIIEQVVIDIEEASRG